MDLRRLVALVSTLSIAPAALADDFDRPGFYLGANGIAGIDLFSGAIQDAVQDALFLPVSVDVDPAAGFNVRAGYRLFSWFALELGYEYVDGFDTNIDFAGVTFLTAEAEFHTLTGNLKFLVPTWRIQPYLLLGLGAQYGEAEFDSPFPGLVPLASLFDNKSWALAGRPAFGIDFYVTKNFVINTELASVLGARDINAPGSSSTDVWYLTAGLGLQWRF